MSTEAKDSFASRPLPRCSAAYIRFPVEPCTSGSPVQTGIGGGAGDAAESGGRDVIKFCRDVLRAGCGVWRTR